MGKIKSWRSYLQDSNYSLAVRLECCGKTMSLTVPPLMIALLILCGMCSYKIANMEALSAQARQTQKISDLERKNRQLTSYLEHKEKERDQMVALADARSRELWEQLEARDQEIERLWDIVGAKPETIVRQGTRPRQSLLGSRRGYRRNALAVKVGYSQLSSQVQQGELELTKLMKAAWAYRERRVAEYRAELADRTPSIHPCEGELSSEFGDRIHPVYGYGRFHGGVDFTAEHGTPIRSTAAGVVCHSDWLGGYGQAVEIDHGDGLKTLYAHCSDLVVKKGDRVEKGQLIAKVGTTGLSSGPHCHYEVRREDKPIDPKPFLGEGPVVARTNSPAL